MRRLTDIHPKVAAGTVSAVLVTIAAALLQKWGVQLDVDSGQVVKDLTGLDFGTLNLSVRQALTAGVALAMAYLWPEESPQELAADSPEDLDEATGDAADVPLGERRLP